MESELIDLLEQEARTEKDKVLAEARARAADTVASARREADEIVAASRRRAEEERAQARARAASTASLRSAGLVLAAKDGAIRTVFEQAERDLRAAVANPTRRRAMLRAFLREAAGGLQGGRAVVEVPPGDGEAVRDASREVGLDVEVRGTPQVSDGVRVVSPDGRAAVETTMPSRLARARREMVSRVAEILWGG
jgi:V/A-type H+-transporting ATPase subunit E